MSKFGRYQVAEPHSSLLRAHLHKGGPLHTVDWEPKIGVLDQEDLISQGIRCSEFIPGISTDPDALGSCTANATTAALSNLLPGFLETTGCTGFDDVIAAEKWAIGFYHQCSSQTADTSTEWPPTDCGSSGPFIVKELQALALASGDRVAHGADNIVSLMQDGGLLAGVPFLNAWMEPDSNGFVDGDGSPDALSAAIAQGVAGGHEIFLSAVEDLEYDRIVDPAKTVIRFRNSWSSTWGDSGSGRFHLSTLVMLGAYCDFRLLVA